MFPASQALLLAVMDVWLERTDAIGAPAARKLSAAAMAAALTLPVPAIVQRLDLMVSHVTSVCYEVRDRRRSPLLSLHSPTGTRPPAPLHRRACPIRPGTCAHGVTGDTEQGHENAACTRPSAAGLAVTICSDGGSRWRGMGRTSGTATA